MFRFLIVLALCGHLAHATAIPSETSSRTTTTERYVTATVKSTETVDGGWSSYTDALEALSKVKEWFGEAYASIRDRVNGLRHGDAEVPTPLYKDLCTADIPFGYEARSYNDSVWATVINVWSGEDAVSYATTKLQEYFSGRNDQNLNINMTTPLRTTRPRSDNESTVSSYSLYLPREWHDNPPQPVDGEVVLQREPATRYFVKTFSSHISSLNSQELSLLETLLNQRREQFVGDQFSINVYDPSSNRPNEVMLKMKPSVVEPTCKVTLSDLKLLDEEEPQYVQLCEDDDDYEARMYFRAAWVSTTVNSLSPQLAELTALPLLDKYFDRYNSYGALIPKTEPVRLTKAWPTSAPVPGSSQDYTFSYFIPFDPAHAIPQPLDNNVILLDEPASTIFAMSFSSFSFNPYNTERLQELRSYLDEEGEDYAISEPFAFEFYSSKSFLFHYSEVLVRMGSRDKQPRCIKDSIPPCFHRGKHCPSYRIMETFNGNIEHRHLAGSLYVMKRTHTCIMDDAYDDAYMLLHRYFYGQNSKQEHMTRTTPVILVHKSTESPPTGCDFTYNLMFYLPPDQHHDPPEPTEDGVEFLRHESKETYAITFTNSTNIDAKEEELRTELDKRGLCYSTDEFFIATYDAPWRQGPHRFEIWISQAMCTASPSLQGHDNNMVDIQSSSEDDTDDSQSSEDDTWWG
ncbi:uncharacterized protein LOC117303083 [Asterias rubens]|uniref:uncharacterized protein LOC117303083 n=1 Tax=Asterias rubens TaxID=7604 RepID=UPI0014554F14|nr:uncharacterized protein LOC117303083 [Asterias rubens]